MNTFTSFFMLLALTLAACGQANYQAQNKSSDKSNIATPAVAEEMTEEAAKKLSIATFAGGCFWCTEAQFERIQGVSHVVSGYAGGTTPNPTYKQVASGQTDYAETIQIYYDSKIITYPELLEIFFAGHDPTQLNRQGPDIGAQYRSEVFYRD